MSEISKCHEPGLLLTFTRPTSPAYLSEYHHWYDTEHGPARLNLDFVENGCRYKGKDDAQIWAATYELKRVSATTESQYTNLRNHPSSREQHILNNKVEVLEQKIYKHLSTRGCSQKPAPVITCVSFVVQTEDVGEVNRWYEEQHIGDLSRIPGWRRSRRFQLVDGDVLPGCIELFAIHDFDEDNGLGGAEHMRARHRPWREKIVQLAKARANREFELCHEFRAEDYSAPPETSITGEARRPDMMLERRSSLASGFEHGTSSPMSVNVIKHVVQQVH